MSRYLAFLLLLLFFTACVSFKTAIPEEPECLVDYVAILKKLPEKANYDDEIESQQAAVADPTVYALIKVCYLKKPVQLQWSWYGPDRLLVKRSKILEINAKAKNLAYAVGWDVLPNRYFADKSGQWTVVITADGAFLAKSDFEIK